MGGVSSGCAAPEVNMGTDVGRFFWFEPSTSDVAAARRFYTALIGWQTTPFAGGDYELWNAGGRDVGGPMDVPGGDRIAQCMDPQGALFAIYSSAR